MGDSLRLGITRSDPHFLQRLTETPRGRATLLWVVHWSQDPVKPLCSLRTALLHSKSYQGIDQMLMSPFKPPVANPLRSHWQRAQTRSIFITTGPSSVLWLMTACSR